MRERERDPKRDENTSAISLTSYDGYHLVSGCRGLQHTRDKHAALLDKFLGQRFDSRGAICMGLSQICLGACNSADPEGVQAFKQPQVGQQEM